MNMEPEPSSAELTKDDPSSSRIVHRLAVLSVCLVWPLIWVGGLVTTYDAGMAVPDWPNTYGYNLFLYPYKTWLLGPFDLFIEHGHRLLGAVVGFVAIGLAVAAYLKETRRWVFWFAVAVLLAVIFQGALGGIRVVQMSRTLAMVHGCFGPAFFAACVALAVVTSRSWRDSCPADRGQSAITELAQVPRSTVILGLVLVALGYTQLVLGAQLRHVQPTMRPDGFATIVVFHVVTAFVLWSVTAVGYWRMRKLKSCCGDLTLWRPAAALIGLVLLQIVLGTGTWVANYGWPTFLQGFPGATGFLIRAKGFWDSIVVTAHVATGSLILAVSTMIWVRSWRLRYCSQSASEVANET
ncbi:COX15/CtaA family protein [Stieleria marina]|uniref:Heme A synthase n=1 Tax=Stieleria marina TaxID=1930275 RepID=A0A517NPG4_9BACT|nr:Heme A synthase [Planctomycetes bacterium K23_9]